MPKCISKKNHLEMDDRNMKKSMNESKEINMDKVKGGKSDGMTCKKIAKMHKVPLSLIMKEYKMGLIVEKEHSDDPEIQGEVARDHLYENPRYYSEGKKSGVFDEFKKCRTVKKSIPEEKKKKVREFLANYTGDFNDNDIHEFADKMGIEHAKIEEYIYSLARKESKVKKSIIFRDGKYYSR